MSVSRGRSKSSGQLSFSFARPISYGLLFSSLIPELRDELFSKGLIVFCGEPGMGLAECADLLLEDLRRGCARTLYKSFGGLPSCKCSDALVKFSRETIKTYAGADVTVVCLDGFSTSDEFETRRQARAISRMVESGICVMLVCDPEVQQLYECFDRYGLVDCRSILVDRIEANLTDVLTAADLEASRGIPSLLVGSRRASLLTEEQMSIAYFDSLSDLIRRSVRGSLTDGEIRLRTLLLLMGSGSLEAVCDLLGSATAELLAELEITAPLYGVSTNERTFLTLPEQVNMPFGALLNGLRSTLVRCQDEIAQDALLIADAGDLPRAAQVCKRLSASHAAKLVYEYGAELLDMGELSLVKGVIDEPRDEEVGEANISWGLSRALEALTRTGGVGGVAEIQAMGGDYCYLDAKVQTSLLFCDARLRLKRSDRQVPANLKAQSSLVQRLCAHARAVNLIFAGEFSEAMAEVASVSTRGDAPTISGALLAIDAELARLFACDPLPEDDSWFEACCEFLQIVGARGLVGYADAAKAMREVFRGGGTIEVTQLAASAERSGDALIQAMALMGMAIVNLREGAWTHASVVARMATGLANNAGDEQMARVTSILGDAARFRLGEKKTPEVTNRDDGLGMVLGMISDAMSEENVDVVPSSLEEREMPGDSVWLLLVLSEGMGDFSSIVRNQIPAAWRRNLEIARRNLLSGEDGLVEELAAGGEGVRASRHKEAVRINLFGSFSLYAGGRKVNDGLLEARRAKALLEYMALQRHKSAGRSRVAEQLWPECEYKKGIDRIYQTTSCVRRALRSVGFEKDPFLKNRTDQTIALNADLVSCDVDDFRRCAKVALTSSDDGRIVEMALGAEAVYVGDLVVPTLDPTGYITNMAAMLRTSYADVMTAGAEAALRLEKRRVAARLADNALLVDELREDALAVLIRVLKASGRLAEAQRRYELYATRLAEVAGRAPSKRLRALVIEGSDGDDFSKDVA